MRKGIISCKSFNFLHVRAFYNSHPVPPTQYLATAHFPSPWATATSANITSCPTYFVLCPQQHISTSDTSPNSRSIIKHQTTQHLPTALSSHLSKRHSISRQLQHHPLTAAHLTKQHSTTSQQGTQHPATATQHSPSVGWGRAWAPH